ncbi:NAD(P)H-hydrate epimerase [Altererythrobacter sp. KTW20L]|uniref:NAD(P)H-hydrate epimerase n=1 Tax=Altererythrobacter sp. KTW20L TaxID=2942210 RepID=UPI0020BD5B51|nr:NAD(P)H-hydrate epimerase [Altererythrobacter sp. KTW20L]MCL6251863.1 NAD(P)H-hydrate epimerase [Altererythrobacter sp. KTW20L]
MHPSNQVLTVAQVQAAEQALVDGGETISGLMERAGAGAAQWVWRMAAGRPVTVLCGPGNNGGDGYVIARILEERGLKVSVIAPVEPRTDAARAARAAWGGEPVADARGGVFVDCLFGSGLARALDDNLLSLLRRLAQAHDLRVAVDLPSGINADSGEPLNPLLPHYDLTVALDAWKFAHWLMPAMPMMGTRKLVPIGLEQVGGAAQMLSKPRLSPPVASAHKYSRGFVGVIGGAMPGAGELAAMAAMRSGAGYVKLFADDAFPAMPELVTESGIIDELVADQRLDVLVVGPGLGRDALAREKLQQVLARELPTVIDGDALALLDPAMLSGRRAGLVLTPHAGELETLYRACEIEAGSRFGRLFALSHDTGSVVIAKGPDTIIAAPDGGMTLGASAMAPSWLSVAGSGDVLAGLVASRLATGLTLEEGARQAVWLHARAGQIAGPACLPGDLVDAIPQAIGECL